VHHQAVTFWGACRLGMVGLTLLALPVWAAELRILAAGAVREVVQEQAALHEQETGTKLDLVFAAIGSLKAKILAGEQPDLVIMTPAVFKELTEGGTLHLTAQAPLGRVGVGVAIKSGGTRPDLSSVATFTHALLATTALAYGDPKGTSSGAYFAQVLDRLGIAAQVQGKTQTFPDGHATMVYLATADSQAMGVTQISEIIAHVQVGIEFVGPLPSALQTFTTYVAGLPATASSAMEARAFYDRLRGPTAQKRFAAAGFEAVQSPGE
jgi:molybdate transport system substrate-binding protein